MKQTYKVLKVGKQAVSGVLEAGQFFGRWFSHSLAATSVLILSSTSATGHTNSVGYLLSSSSVSSCVNGGTDCYDVEVFYGTWHSMTMAAEGDLAIYQILSGSELQVIGQSALNGSQVPFSLAHSQTGTIPNPGAGVAPNYSDVNSAAYSSLQSVFTLGTDYFFHDDNADVLVGTPNSDVDDVYAHQSAIASGLAPGTYRVDYDSATASDLSATWDPQQAISLATFTIGSGGSLSIQAPGTNRDINASGDTISNLVDMSGSVLNSVFDGGELIIDQDLATTAVASFAIKSGTGNAQLNVASGDDHSVGSKFTDNSGDAGVLEKVGAGTLVLTNTANDYTGGTTVSAGTLEIASDSVLGATSGGVTLNGGTLATTANMSSARSVSLGASNGTVDTATATTLTLSGVMSGSGLLTKAGAGVLTVTGTNTYTGGTTVSAGTLDLDGSLTSDVAVASTGRIEGVGSTSGDLTSSGTVAPGNSPGTLTVAGDVVFTGTNNFITELDGLTYSAAGGAGTYDRLAVTGTTATFTAAGAIAPILRGISAPANNTLDPVIGDAFRVVTTANT